MTDEHTPCPVSRSEFAARCGVSPAAITKALKKALLAAAYGRQVDTAHPDAIAYHEEKTNPTKRGKGRPPTKKGPKTKPKPRKRRQGSKKRAPDREADEPEKSAERTPRGRQAAAITKKQGPAPKAIDNIPVDLRQYLDWPWRRVVETFGTDVRLKDWLNGTKMVEDIEAARVKNAKINGELVSMALVRASVIEPIETFHVKLLTDCAKTLANRISAKARAGAPIEECEKETRTTIERFLKPMKRKITKGLKDA